MSNSILRLRGLPYEADQKEIESFFEDFELTATHLVLRGGKFTGEAYVQFKDAEEADRALKEKQREHIGSRYIEIFEAGEAQLVATVTSGDQTKPSRPSLEGYLVRLRGLPFSSSAEDVVEFFKPLEVLNSGRGVVFTRTPDGRPTGEAFVEFASSEDQEQALTRHKELLGSRYIEIFESKKGDMFQAVQQRGFFTNLGGRKEPHPPLSAGVDPGATHGHAPSGTGKSRGGGSSGSGGVEGMTQAFRSFDFFSRYDRQVPGPAAHQAASYFPDGGKAHFGGGHRPAVPAWGAAMQGIPPGPSFFNPAPGPAGVDPGTRGVSDGRGRGRGRHIPAAYDYSQQAVIVNPFVPQHPFMQQQSSPWGYVQGSPQQQQGMPWYGGHHGQYHRGQYHHQGYHHPVGHYTGQAPNNRVRHQPGQGGGIQRLHHSTGVRSVAEGGAHITMSHNNNGDRYNAIGSVSHLDPAPRPEHPNGELPVGVASPEHSEHGDDSPRSTGSAESCGSTVVGPETTAAE